MRRVIDQARLAASGRMPVTIVGEPGAGKHWLARAIHQASGQRDRCFAALDCRTLPPILVTELLLDVRGRRLALGTVYLREPAELPRELQDQIAGLLRSPESAELPRVIVGHRSEPADLVRIGQLSAELHAATGILTIALPPLRERLADIVALIAVLVDHLRLLTEAKTVSVSPEAILTLRSHTWPGNLRELAAVLDAAHHHARGERVDRADLPFYLRQGPLPADKTLPLDKLLEEAERRLIAQALKHAKGNRARAAEILGIWRPRLIRRLEHFGIGPKTPDDAGGQPTSEAPPDRSE
jgi:two-component system NtrC family response regulator